MIIIIIIIIILFVQALIGNKIQIIFNISFKGGSSTCNSATTSNKFCGQWFTTDVTSAPPANIPICGNPKKHGNIK